MLFLLPKGLSCSRSFWWVLVYLPEPGSPSISSLNSPCYSWGWAHHPSFVLLRILQLGLRQKYQPIYWRNDLFIYLIPLDCDLFVAENMTYSSLTVQHLADHWGGRRHIIPFTYLTIILQWLTAKLTSLYSDSTAWYLWDIGTVI